MEEYSRQGIDKEIERNRIRRRAIQKELRWMPEGKLALVKRKDRTVYRQIVQVPCESEAAMQMRTEQHEINRNHALIERLARKEYLQSEMRLIEANSECLRKLKADWQGTDQQSVIAAMPKRCRRLPASLIKSACAEKRKHVPRPMPDEPIREARLEIGSDQIADWGTSPYRENVKYAEDKVHVSSAGIAFRSKSELLLGEWYLGNSIPFHYDEAILCCGRVVSPDFIFARPDGRLIYHEHWGLIEDESYLRANVEKLSLYAQAGIVAGVNLVITADECGGGVDLQKAEGLIRAHLGF